MSTSKPGNMEPLTTETPDALNLIGKLAVRFRMIDEMQLEQALQAQAAGEPKSPVGQSLVELGLISESQLNFLLSAQQMKAQRSRDMKFGRIAVEHGFVTEQQIEAVLQRQKTIFIKEKKQVLVGDLLEADGIITAEQKRLVIEQQLQIKLAQQEALNDTTVALQQPEVSIEEGVELTVSSDGMRATLRAAPGLDQEAIKERIEALFQEYGISYGRVPDHALTEWLLQGEGREKSFLIAEGKQPVCGHGGKIRYHFDTDPLKAGKIKEGDIIDFRDRGEIPQVDEGALLAEVSEPDPGISGTDVYGEVVPPPAVKPTLLLCDKGVTLSEDGRQASAQLSGTPSLAKTGALSVFPLYQVDGNVGLKTGHIEFDGDIQVSGTVEKDFRIKGGKLAATEVEAAEIEIKGDVVISGGILGARIKAGGNLMAAYIHNSVIEVDGDVLVQKEIRGCDIKCGGGLYSKTSIVLDSHIAAKDGVIAGDIGSEVSGPSTLLIGSDALLELRISRLNETMDELREKQKRLRESIESATAENQQINIDIAEQAQVQDRSQVEQRELSEKREQMQASGETQQAEDLAEKIKQSVQRASEAEQQLNALFDRQDQIASEEQQHNQQVDEAEEQITFSSRELEVLEQQMLDQQADVAITVNGTLYPMTTITTAHTSVKTRQAMQALRIREAMRRSQAGDEVWKIVTESLR